MLQFERLNANSLGHFYTDVHVYRQSFANSYWVQKLSMSCFLFRTLEYFLNSNVFVWSKPLQYDPSVFLFCVELFQV